ncbi:MAG: glutamine-synthetase adenylyltransferase, partial [Sphingomonadales bacterium]
MTVSSDLANALDRARAHSSFLALLLSREPGITENLSAALQDPRETASAAGGSTVAARLRVERRRLALIVALGDLSGAYDLTRVTQLLTDFADDALDCAIRTAIHERTPDAEP